MCVSRTAGLVGSLRGVAGAIAFLAAAGPVIGDIPHRFEDFQIVADDDVAGRVFGAAVAADAGTLVVGAYLDQANGIQSGAAYLVDLGSREQIAKLVPSDGGPGDRFGIAVAIGDGVAVVGAPHEGDFVEGPGAAYIYDAATGAELFKLSAGDVVEGDAFGRAVAIRNGIVVVGAEDHDAVAENSGAVYLFRSDDGTLMRKLVPEDGAANDKFGSSVAVQGNLVVVGARGARRLSDMVPQDTGAVYVFDAHTGHQLGKMQAMDSLMDDTFGMAIAVAGDFVLIGAENHDPSGAAYLFRVSTCDPVYKFEPPDGEGVELFGHAVALSGRHAVIGAYTDNENGLESVGSVYVFDVQSGRLVAKLLSSSGMARDGLGDAVCESGGVVLAGASGTDLPALDVYSAGAVLGFHISCLADFAPPFGVLDLADVALFVHLFASMDPLADFDPDGVFDLSDVTGFVRSFMSGCNQ